MSQEVSRQLQPMATAVGKVESAIVKNESAVVKNESAIQHLQAEITNGNFLLKIPDIWRRSLEAKTGETMSLRSAYFYTGQYGYKICLRLYLNGDGTGKGTHLSFFFVIMKGEYDDILPWPFEHPVTLMLLDRGSQVPKKNIVETFKPDVSSSSFQRPQTEMNIASGCPKFAPLAVLNDSSYVKDDTMFLMCKIDTTTHCGED